LKEDQPARPSAEKVGEAFAKAAGADSIKALRAVTAEKIIEIFTNNAEGRRFRTQPNVDGWVLPNEIRDIFARGKQNDVPVILGSNANEMTSLTTPAQVPKTIEEYRKRIETQYRSDQNVIRQLDALYPVKTEADIADAYLGALRDTTFTLPMRTWARMTGTGRSKAWLYFFTHVPPNPNSKYLGAYHAGEIIYVFNNLRARDAGYQESDYKLADMMSSYWVNFATSGDPNGQGLVKWGAFDKEKEPYIEFSASPQMRNHLLKEQLDLIERIQGQPRPAAAPAAEPRVTIPPMEK
jgi:para-nitrobenzyl esterase